jgi:hypothetical protein
VFRVTGASNGCGFEPVAARTGESIGIGLTVLSAICELARSVEAGLFTKEADVGRFRIGAWLVGAMMVAGTAEAQLPSNYSGAVPLAVNSRFLGVYVPLSSHTAGALAQLRLSFFPSVDFGFQGGLSRLDRNSGNRTLLRLGTDIKIAVAHATPGMPVDIALGGSLGVWNGDDYSLVAVGPTGVASHTWRRGQSGEFTAIGGLGLGFTTLNTRAFDHTDFYVPVRLGGELTVSPMARIVGEIEFRVGLDAGDDVGVTLGANLPF